MAPECQPCSGTGQVYAEVSIGPGMDPQEVDSWTCLDCDGTGLALVYPGVPSPAAASGLLAGLGSPSAAAPYQVAPGATTSGWDILPADVLPAVDADALLGSPEPF